MSKQKLSFVDKIVFLKSQVLITNGIDLAKCSNAEIDKLYHLIKQKGNIINWEREELEFRNTLRSRPSSKPIGTFS